MSTVEAVRRRRPDPREARRRELETPRSTGSIDAYTRGYVADEQMAAMTMAIFLNGMSRREIRDMTMAMIASGERMDFSGLGKPHQRQALDRRRRRQDHAAADAPRGDLRRRGAAALRSRARAHGRHARQARVDPGLARRPHATTRCSRSCRDVGGVICAAGVGPRAGRQEALRAARHHRHGRGDPAHRVVDHVEEDRRGHGRARARRQVRLGRVPARTSTARASSPARWSSSATDAGVATSALLTEHERAARPHDRQRQRGARVGRGARRRRPRRRRASSPSPSRARCSRSPGSPTPTSRRALDDGRAMDTWRAMIRAQGGDPDAALPVAREQHVVTADRDGVLVAQEALPFGIAAWRLGAGRARKEDPVQHAAGIELHAKPGDEVRAGQPALHPARRRRVALRACARGASKGAWRIGAVPSARPADRRPHRSLRAHHRRVTIPATARRDSDHRRAVAETAAPCRYR